MTNYVQSIDFSDKDALPSGTPAKLGRGADIDTELGLISTAIASKEDSANKNASNGYAGLAGGFLSAAQLPDDGVTNARMANMAQSTVKGRAVGAGTGDPTDLTPVQLSAILQDGGDGAGSGLDADLLDGVQGSGYALAAHNHSAADLTSGTLADGRVALSNVSQHAASIKTRNLPGSAGTNVTLQADPGGTPSGSAGEVFEYY